MIETISEIERARINNVLHMVRALHEELSPDGKKLLAFGAAKLLAVHARRRIKAKAK